MSSGRSSAPPVLVLVVLAVVLAFVGRTVWQWMTEPEAESPGTLAEQAEEIPGVAEVRVESGRVAGAGGHRSSESWVTFDEQILADPAASAARLADVSWGWRTSHWTVRGTPSTAEVHYVSQVDPAPFAWWLQGVAALEEAAPGTGLACEIRYGFMECDATGGDATAAREALTGLDAGDVRTWVEGSSPDEDQPSGFVLRVGGQEVPHPGR